MAVVEVKGKSTYACQDLCTLRVEAVHVSRLKAYNGSATASMVDVAGADRSEWRVDSIVCHRFCASDRKKKGRCPGKQADEFRVRWASFGPSGDNWLPDTGVLRLLGWDGLAGVTQA